MASCNQDCQKKYQLPQYAHDTTLMSGSEEELKSLLKRVKEESEKAGLKLNIQKTKIMASSPTTSWQILCVVLVTQSGLTLCDTMDYSLPGSFVREILQARILEWVAISFSIMANRWGNNGSSDRLYFPGLQNHCRW